MSTLAGPVVSGARIGPHTIIQVASVLRERFSPTFADAVLRDATHYTLDTMPREMVHESEAQRVVRALVQRMGAAIATPILREAGYRTADYLLAHHIPGFAQFVIRRAPRRVGLRRLLSAMQANAWTFAGSGRFCVEPAGRTPDLVFHDCAMCRGMHENMPMCDFYAGTFERLLGVLISGDARVTEVSCMAQGAPVCRFQLHGV